MFDAHDERLPLYRPHAGRFGSAKHSRIVLVDTDASSRTSRRSALLALAVLAGLVVGAGLIACNDTHFAHCWSAGDDASAAAAAGVTAKALKRNVIFMVSDGFGPTSETFGRSIFQYTVNGGHSNLPPYDGDYPHQLPLDTILVGQSRTRSSDSWITDSAAGATAFSCIDKSYNGAIGVNSTLMPCATVLEAAKAVGMHTGLVVTSRITHATPGAFSSHVTWRNYENEIAVQQIGDSPLGRTVDLMFGGGRCHFQPASVPGSCRRDERDLEAEARTKHGFRTTISTRSEFDALTGDKADLPMMGLFGADHLPYNIDLDPSAAPSLNAMTRTALRYLQSATADSDKGFFLLVEGSRIDMAAHDNDAAAHAHEILHYQQVIQTVKDFVDANPGTVMISVSDHETGGLALGAQLSSDYPAYEWNPEPIVRVRNSSETVARMILEHPPAERETFVRNIIMPVVLGIDDHTNEDVTFMANRARTANDLTWFVSQLVSRRAKLKWSTHGHTGVDVNLYAYAGPSDDSAIAPLRGNHENTELGAFVAEYLGLQPMTVMRDITAKLVLGVQTGTLITHPPDSPPVPAMAESAVAGGIEQADDRYHSFRAMHSG